MSSEIREKSNISKGNDIPINLHGNLQYSSWVGTFLPKVNKTLIRQFILAI